MHPPASENNAGVLSRPNGTMQPAVHGLRKVSPHYWDTRRNESESASDYNVTPMFM